MGLRKELFQKKYILTIAKPEKVTIFAFPIKGIRTGAVVQSVRISACHAGGREFESRPHRREPLTQVRGSFFLRCRDSASSGKTRGNPLLRALILDFKPRLANRCKETLKNSPKAASILDFKPRLGNRCKDFPENNLLRASILDFRAKLGNRCSAIVAAQENGPPAECRCGRRQGQVATETA